MIIQRSNLPEPSPFEEFAEAKALGITTKPVIIGAFTLLKLLRYVGKKQATDYADAVSAAYAGGCLRSLLQPAQNGYSLTNHIWCMI